jgi:hypothetical protein
MDMFSFTRFCLRVLADLNEIIRRMKPNVILTIAVKETGGFGKRSCSTPAHGEVKRRIERR